MAIPKLEDFSFFGAHFYSDGTALGCGIRFCVYAPTAIKVKVVLARIGLKQEMYKTQENNKVWELKTKQFKLGDAYFYLIKTQDGRTLVKLDPYSFTNQRLSSTPGIASVVTHNPYTPFQWSDQIWMEKKSKTDLRAGFLNIYQLHPVCWKKNSQNNLLNYRELALFLAQYCTEMSYTHVQLMATLDYPTERGSNGFKVCSYFSPNSRLGTKADFQFLVDHLHQNHIGVILSWTPNTCCIRDESTPNPIYEMGLYQFDGTDIFTAGFYRYGPKLDLSKAEVRNFLISSAVYWAREMHVDGIYVDCSGGIFCPDGKRDSHHEDSHGSRFLKEFNETVHRQFPGIMTFSEDSHNLPKLTSFSQANNPQLFDYNWHFPFILSSVGLLESPLADHKENQQDEFWKNLKEAFSKEANSDNRVLAFSNDVCQASIRNDEKTYFTDSAGIYHCMEGTVDEKISKLRLHHALTIATPGKKFIYMGHEFGQVEGWNLRLLRSFKDGDDVQAQTPAAVAWEELSQYPHQSLQGLHKFLNQLYKNTNAFWELENSESKGMRNVNFDNKKLILSFERFSSSPVLSTLCLFNFSRQDSNDYKLQFKEKPLSMECSAQVYFLSKEYHGNAPTMATSITLTGLTIAKIPSLCAVYVAIKRKA
ncbi:MAG: hypothetical protein JSS10_08490 [Verrucomicrobia bacterium]|nr:hypothetical protein [Verrucomicrobiota bacterium]